MRGRKDDVTAGVGMLDERVVTIVDNAVMGETPSRSDLVFLLRFDAYSPEAAYVCARAREVGMRACNRKGYVYAQIGVDSSPCPRNCRRRSPAHGSAPPAPG